MSSTSPTSEAPTPRAGAEQIGRAVERTAVRFVRTWGFSTVEMVAARFRMTTKATVPRASLARQGLNALPDIEWLDPKREWFTLMDCASPMRAAMEKVLSAFPVVERDDLEQALGKRHSFGAAPPAVVGAFVDALFGRVDALFGRVDALFGRAGALRGGVDARRRGVSGRGARAALGTEERLVLEALERLGGHAAVALVREGTRGQLSPAALNRILQTSPLFLHAGRGAYRLAGSIPLPYVTFAGRTTIVAPIQ